METRTLAPTAIEPSNVPFDRLFRVSPDVYQGMLEHGLLPEGGQVAFVDGLLVDEGTERLHPITLEVYEAMVDLGLLTKYDKIELLDGLMVEKMGRGDWHIGSTYGLTKQLEALRLAGFHVKPESPIALPDGPAGRASMPEPDVAVIRGGWREYFTRKPGPADVPFVAEVAESSVREDREGLARYAWVKIPIVWIVNLADQNVEVYSNPTGPADPAKYETVKVYGADDRIPVVIDGREAGQIAVKEILP